MKERSKLVKAKRKTKTYDLGARLGNELLKDEEMKEEEVPSNKRRKGVNPKEQKIQSSSSKDHAQK